MRFTRVSLAAALAGLLVVAAPAQAQTQEPSVSHLAAARELLVSSGAAASIDRILPVLVNDIRRVGVTRPDLAKDLDEVIAAMAPEMERQKEQGYAVAARAYAKFLSEQEIKDATAFFVSPIGRRYVAVQPQVTEDLINSVTAWSQLAAEYVMTRVRADMLKRGHQLQ